MHASRKDVIPTPIFGGIRPDKPLEPRNGKTENNVEERSYNYSMERKTGTTVRPATDAIVGHNSVTNSAVAEYTIMCSKDSIAFDNTVPKDILKESLTA